jgi:hypothetical protein
MSKKEEEVERDRYKIEALNGLVDAKDHEIARLADAISTLAESVGAESVGTTVERRAE